MCKFVMLCLGIMAGAQLLQNLTAPCFLWQLLPGEVLHCNPHHDIILKNNCACSFQCSCGLALCQRCTILMQSLCFSEDFLLLCGQTQSHVFQSACFEAVVSGFLEDAYLFQSLE